MQLSDTLRAPAAYFVGAVEEMFLEQARTLEQFLAGVEKRAFRLAQIAVRDADDALDIVQEAMLHLARRYAQRPSEEWQPLFYRILRNRIRDCQRRRMVRNKLFAWLPGARHEDEDEIDPLEVVSDDRPDLVRLAIAGEAMQALERALRTLPPRQLQAFLLRNLEGMDVAQTASAMQCSESSAKTHYARALEALRERLGDAWGDASDE